MTSSPRTIRSSASPAVPLDAQYAAALELAQQGRSSDAEAAYQQLAALATGQLLALVHNDLAVLASIQARPADALRHWRLALTADSDCAVAQQNLRDHEPTSASDPGRVMGQIKIAITSLLFNWPSAGGGNVHTVELALALAAAGYEVKHFCAQYEPWKIGGVDGTCPIQSEILEFDDADWHVATIQDRFRRAVTAWSPDFVVVTDSWNFKPYLAEAVEQFPYVLRFDALECLCPLNNLRQLPHSPSEIRVCPRHRLATPDDCVTCVGELGHRSSPLHQSERPLSEFSTAAYHALLLRVLARAEAALVFNPLIGALLEPYARCVRVVPAGVHAARYMLPKSPADKRPYQSILFAGRVADPVKGFHVLFGAAAQLWRERQDFRLVVTGKPSGAAAPFLDFRGWAPHSELPALLAECDLLVAPATAPEPFGITAIEAMAAARPVVASRIGGLQFTVLDEVTGLLFEPGSTEDLAAQLSRLLDDPEHGRQMGYAGRKRVLERYDWKAVVQRHYDPLFQRRSAQQERA